MILDLRDGFSDMRDLLGYEESPMALLAEPQAFSELLERVVEYNLQPAAVAQQRYGVQILATTDDVANATALLMRPETYFEMVAPHFRRVLKGYKDLGYLCIKHCDVKIDAVIDLWIECGIDCLDPVDPGGGFILSSET